MNTSEVIYLGGLRCEAIHLASGNKVITDAPVDNNGKGEAFSPTDLLATALALCMITIMGIEADKLGINMDGTIARVLKTMAPNPRRVVKVTIEMSLPERVSGYKTELEFAAHNCPVAKSLHTEIEQHVTFSYTL